MCLYIDVHKIVIKVIAEYKKGKYRRTTEKPYVMMRNMCERLVLCVHLCGHQSHQPGIFYKCLVRFFSSPLLSLAIVGEYFIRLSSFLFVALVSATDTLLLLWMNRPFPLRTTKPEQKKKQKYLLQTNKSKKEKQRQEKNKFDLVTVQLFPRNE